MESFVSSIGAWATIPLQNNEILERAKKDLWILYVCHNDGPYINHTYLTHIHEIVSLINKAQENIYLGIRSKDVSNK